jgi:hypothetical protein
MTLKTSSFGGTYFNLFSTGRNGTRWVGLVCERETMEEKKVSQILGRIGAKGRKDFRVETAFKKVENGSSGD